MINRGRQLAEELFKACQALKESGYADTKETFAKNYKANIDSKPSYFSKPVDSMLFSSRA